MKRNMKILISIFLLFACTVSISNAADRITGKVIMIKHMGGSADNTEFVIKSDYGYYYGYLNYTWLIKRGNKELNGYLEYDYKTGTYKGDRLLLNTENVLVKLSKNYDLAKYKFNQNFFKFIDGGSSGDSIEYNRKKVPYAKSLEIIGFRVY